MITHKEIQTIRHQECIRLFLVSLEGCLPRGGRLLMYAENIFNVLLTDLVKSFAAFIQCPLFLSETFFPPLCIPKIPIVAVVQSLSRVQLSATPWTISLPGSSAHGISQARIPEQIAIFFSKKIPTLTPSETLPHPPFPHCPDLLSYPISDSKLGSLQVNLQSLLLVYFFF